ncbi:MAG: ribulose-phosphate 3-epimerase [Deltaproteobacteria bacterium]|jgi:ribulose-phosphate 3-epimerase|nr:ribulose-phosphate 3-epimerase [Deltaproteobacteria bacterium]
MILSPSLLSSDFGRLAEELQALEQAGLTWAHWDVMDGAFVPNITFGPPVIKRLRQTSRLFFDVHLMIEHPERYLADFAEAGADLLVVHVEAAAHLPRTLDEIRRLGMKAGVALNPATPLCSLNYVLDKLDLALIMSVNPGFGGQKFMPLAYDKISELKAKLKAAGSSALIQVDGGVDPTNTPRLLAAGADVLVSGSAFFNFPPYAERLKAFQMEEE